MEHLIKALIVIVLVVALVLVIKAWNAITRELKELEKDNSHIPAERSDYN